MPFDPEPPAPPACPGLPAGGSSVTEGASFAGFPRPVAPFGTLGLTTLTSLALTGLTGRAGFVRPAEGCAEGLTFAAGLFVCPRVFPRDPAGVACLRAWPGAGPPREAAVVRSGAPGPFW